MEENKAIETEQVSAPQTAEAQAAPTQPARQERQGRFGGGNNNNRGPRQGGGGRDNRKRDNRRQEEQDDLQKKLVNINRVTKVVKGGRTMRFSALVVVGDGKGNVGVGTGKAAEVPMAIEKATQKAKRSMVPVPIVGTTIPHEIIGKFGRGIVLLKPAQAGTGVIAGGSVRSILEVCGYKDIRTKCLGSTNPVNCIKATLDGLMNLKTVEQVARLRGKTVEEIEG